MILAALAAVCLLSVPLRGGRLSRLGTVRLRHSWLAFVALGAQVIIISVVPHGSRAVHVAVYLGSYVLAAGFLWANRRLPGSRLIGAGIVANFLAIAANGGVMPASATAQRIAGLSTGGGFQNSARLAHPHLLWLGDIIPVPGPWPLGNVLSVGDCLLFLGLLILLHRICAPAAQPDPSPA